MISREKILEVIKKVPDENLDELYSIIKDFEVNAENGQSGESVMARLRKIKISASPDFSPLRSIANSLLIAPNAVLVEREKEF